MPLKIILIPINRPIRYRPAAVWRTDWVVDCLAVGSGAAALQYLSADVFQTTLSSARLLADDERGAPLRLAPAGSEPIPATAPLQKQNPK